MTTEPIIAPTVTGGDEPTEPIAFNVSVSQSMDDSEAAHAYRLIQARQLIELVNETDTMAAPTSGPNEISNHAISTEVKRASTADTLRLLRLLGRTVFEPIEPKDDERECFRSSDPHIGIVCEPGFPPQYQIVLDDENIEVRKYRGSFVGAIKFRLTEQSRTFEANAAAAADAAQEEFIEALAYPPVLYKVMPTPSSIKEYNLHRWVVLRNGQGVVTAVYLVRSGGELLEKVPRTQWPHALVAAEPRKRKRKWSKWKQRLLVKKKASLVRRPATKAP